MINEIKQELKQNFNSSFRVIDESDNSLDCDCRNWGQWELPCELDEDDEDNQDYDWEELSSESYNKLQEIIKQLSTKFYDYQFEYSLEEKNYIDFKITKMFKD